MAIKIFSYNVLVNHQKYQIFSIKPCSIYELTKFLNYPLKLTIIEFDGRICNSFKFKNIHLKSNNTLQLLTVVGGG
uniref:Ycf40 n=1 Tax=Schizocladia ischiensis TaxID=196139 RepID=A0A7S6UA06_9STRA|nr:Ycf40 [Schizocladia ischiensis]QOW07580.1 Ycf40 [Schizocladia ischiensis]